MYYTRLLSAEEGTTWDSMSFLILLSVLVALSSGAVLRIHKLPPVLRVVGGGPANITDYPYQVSLEYNGQHFCGGSILDSNTVLTAAHCIGGNALDSAKIRAGTSFRGRDGSVHSINKITNHPRYVAAEFDYDIAIIKVSQPFTYSESIQPISLVKQTPPANSPVIVTGWGLTSEGTLPDQLQEVLINIVDHGECKKAYTSEAEVTSRMVCAAVPEGGKQACSGDSGGPLAYEGQLAGVVNWGRTDCGVKGYPGVYADVAVYRNWILETSGLK